MSKKIFIVYGHHNIKDSFNASIRDTFIDEAKTLGHEIDLINLHEEKPIPFFDGSKPSEQILDYRKRLEKCDVLFMISPCYNLRATAILENWIDLVLAPKWFFSFKRLVGNWGYPVAGAMKDKKAIMSMTYGGELVFNSNLVSKYTLSKNKSWSSKTWTNENLLFKIL